MTQKISKMFFTKLQKSRHKNICVLCHRVIAFDKIKVKTGLAPQNDNQSLGFVKNNKGVAQKMARNGRTTRLGESVFTLSPTSPG